MCFILTNLHIECARFSLYKSERIQYLIGCAQHVTVWKMLCYCRELRTSSVLYLSSIFLIISHFNTRSCTLCFFHCWLVASALMPQIIFHHRTPSPKTHFKQPGWDAKRQKHPSTMWVTANSKKVLLLLMLNTFRMAVIEVDIKFLLPYISCLNSCIYF